MSTDINWGPLVARGRAKAPGIPWSKEEQAALARGVSPDDVRAGILTKEEVVEADEKEKETGERDLARMKKGELVTLAEDLGLDIDAKAASKADLIDAIESAQETGEGEEDSAE